MEITTFDKLNEEDQALVREAMEARKNAYTPYSNHQVGASVRSKSGKIYSCLLYTSPSPRDLSTSRMPSSA